MAAGSGNDSCSVGVAPDATLSGCRAILTASGEELSPEVSDRSFLYINMEQMHVSSNSYGIPSCRLVEASRERRLQTSCPFSSTSPNSPCQSADCAGVDWSNPSPYPQCESTITIYCRINFEYDVQACTSFLDLFVQCQYGSQSIEEHDAFVKGITEGRDGKGIIYVFASGNDYAYGADVNFEGALNSRFVISVGAVGKDTVHASYSNGGAPLFVSGPGGDSETYTTNVVALAGGGCTDGGVGTSFATPVVSGVVALILQANPNLSWRDMQGVLALTSQQVQPDDSSWTTNAAGFHHSYLYGFGLIDASAAVGAAKTWAGFLNEIQIIEESGVVDVSIPEFPNDPVSSTITVQTGDTFVTESVIVYLDLVHSSRGDLEVVLVSPSGTESILAPGQRPENAQSEERWKLMTVRNWGESANGEWTLRLVDRSAGDVASCVDVSGWSIDLGDPGDPLVFDCGDFAFLKICEAGAQGPGFYRYFATTATSISDPYFTNANGTSLTEACCECGGGVLATSVGDTLTSWKIAVYGHDGNSVAATPTTSATPTATTTAGSNPSGTSAGFGNSQPSATSTTGVVPSTSVGAPSVAAVSPTDAYRSSSAANGDNGRRFSMVGGFLFALLYVVLYI